MAYRTGGIMVVVVVALATATTKPKAGSVSLRNVVKPSIECTCSSSHASPEQFGVDCRRSDDSDKEYGKRSGQEGNEERTSYTCQNLQDPAAATAEAERLGYREVPGVVAKRFKLHERNLRWTEAAAACGREGARLATLSGGAAELQAILRAFPEFPKIVDHATRNEYVWVGISDLTNEGTYLTVDGIQMSDLPWGPQEPNNVKPDEDCIAIRQKGQIYDTSCSTRLAFLCEM